MSYSQAEVFENRLKSAIRELQKLTKKERRFFDKLNPQIEDKDGAVKLA